MRSRVYKETVTKVDSLPVTFVYL